MNMPHEPLPMRVDPDDLDKNPSLDAPHLSDLVAQRVARRHFLRSGVGAMATLCLGSLSLTACGGGDVADGREAIASVPTQANENARWRADSLDFTPVAKSIADTLVLPAGYTAAVVHATGDSIDPNVPDYAGDGSETTYSRRIGDHHDGMNWFGLAERQDRPDANSSTRGILVVNHENITGTAQFLHPLGETNLAGSAQPRPADEVIKEQEAHGVSLTELVRAGGRLGVVKASRYNRRITARTEVDLAGPVTATHWVKTKYSPTGTRARGTINNCGHGVTPWGTYLTAEENWAGYFKRNAGDEQPPAARTHQLLRNGMRRIARASRTAAGPARKPRATPLPTSSAGTSACSAPPPPTTTATNTNAFGYIVEIDPYAPLARPKKRTAMGRRANEGAWSSLPKAGRPIAFYVGCDSQNEYVYRYVSDAAWSPSGCLRRPRRRRQVPRPRHHLRGRLRGRRHRPLGASLTLANRKIAAGVPVSMLNPRATSRGPGRHRVNTRLAAGAPVHAHGPPVDRGEPVTGEIYITMTRTRPRQRRPSGDDIPNGPLDAANPRTGSTRRLPPARPRPRRRSAATSTATSVIREDSDDQRH